MLAFTVSVYVAAFAVALVGLVAYAIGPLALAGLGVGIFVGTWIIVEVATRRGQKGFFSPDASETEEERTAYANLHRRIPSSRNNPIIWS